MKKNKTAIYLIVFSSIVFQTSVSHALLEKKTAGLLPPYYLKVPGWQKCTKEKDMGTWRSLCMPDKKPAGCLSASWKDLREKSKIPACTIPKTSFSRKLE